MALRCLVLTAIISMLPHLTHAAVGTATATGAVAFRTYTSSAYKTAPGNIYVGPVSPNEGANDIWIDTSGISGNPAGGSYFVDTNFGSLASADAAAFAAGKGLVVSAVWSTVPSTLNAKIIVAPGGGFNNSSPLTINGYFTAGPHRVFFGAGAVTFGAGALDTVRPEFFGSGLAAMAKAFGVAVAGIPLKLVPNKSYDMGSIAPSTLMSATNAKLKVIGNGATITLATNATGISNLFALTNPVYAIFDHVGFADTGADITQTWRGCEFITIIASGSTIGYGNVTLRDVTTTSGLSPLVVQGGTAAARIRNIRLEGNCVFTNTYYGPVFQNQGDDVSGSWTCNNCRRAYFVYGARHHDVAVRVQHDGVASGSTGAIDIVSDTTQGAVYTDTRGIRVRAEFQGSVANYSSLVNLVNKGDSGAVIDDVRVDLSLADAAWTGSTDQIILQDYNSAGVEQTGTVSNRIDNLVFTGDFYRGVGSVSDSIYPIWVKPTQTTIGSMVIVNQPVGAVAFRRTQYPGFITQYLPGLAEGQTQVVDTSGGGLVFDGSFNAGRWTLRDNVFSLTFAVKYPTTADTHAAKFNPGFTTFPCGTFGISMFGGAVNYTDSGLALSLLVGDGTSDIAVLNAITGATITNAQLSGKTIRGTVSYKIQ